MRNVSSSSSDGGAMNSFTLTLGKIRGMEGLVESSVLDDVKDDLVSLFLLSHSGINPLVFGTDLDSVCFWNPCLFTSSLLNFLLIHNPA
ncbi:hypothetical protein Tco_1282617 [Tanacetum coccineum]